MDNTRFDALARELGAPATRRSAIRTMAAAGFGLGLARLGFDTADAKNKKKGKKKNVTERCKKDDQCKGGLQCKIANSQNYYPETVKRCCKPIGAKCDDGFECCGVDVICNGGYCQGA